MGSRSLLAVFAHPDDEAFGTGGTLAHYATRCVRVVLACATRGEVGEIADAKLATLETLGDERERELRNAARALGIHEVVLLGYRDSGMSGARENEDPRAFVKAHDNEVVGRLVGIIRRVRPQVVITFEPGGGYGHPDHIAISRHTFAAFRAAADPAFRTVPAAGPGESAPWQAARLFYTAIPRSFFVEVRDRMIAHGIDTSQFDRLGDDPRGWPDEGINCTLDVSGEVESKWWALNCHMTQFGPGNLFRRLPDGEMKQLMAREHFALAWPPGVPGQRLDDLFSGLD